ncbi:MAG: NAD(P)-dependent oxidoreductase [Rhodocyclaceae bacterium]|jgi:3-hydroxyisobutyrate dehydrogenase-like beta-hydroxyacid dehydrogenase|nr:NAD(P)-dependent oxidoreductase [Rhodocyclaceae bacterium]
MDIKNTKIGFIGLGNQGAPIARRIIEAGFDTTLWARRPQSLAPFADTPAHQAATLAELGARCDVVGICVLADADVEQVVLGPGGLLSAMSPGSVILIHSTAHPDLCRELAATGERMGVAVLDAPVSGGNARAAAGQMAVMVGGEQAVFKQVLPVLRTFATTIERLGPIGSGQVCKLVNNAVFTINFGAGLALLEAGEQLGMDRQALARMLSGGSAQSFALGMVAAAGADGLRQAEALLNKDIGLLLDVLQARGDGSHNVSDLTHAALATLSAALAR